MNKTTENKLRKQIQTTLENDVETLWGKNINEASLSRIWQHIQSDRTFAVISAYKYDLNIEENIKRHEALRRDIKNLKGKIGFIEQKSGYTYLETNEQIEERSFFIANIDKEAALELGRKYEQETILFKDANSFSEIETNSGKTIRTYDKSPDKSLTFDADTIKRAYSQFVKSKNKNNLKQFSFNSLQEIVIPTWFDAMGSKEKIGVKYIDVV